MKRKLSVYLDTSVISALFDNRNPQRKELTEEFFNNKENFNLYVSDTVLLEIDKVESTQLRDQMIQTVSAFKSFEITPDIEELSKKYVKNGAIPESHLEDAYHIAIATMNEMDCLVSWNFRHIVRRKTKEIIRMVNTLNEFKIIEILTPAELL